MVLRHIIGQSVTYYNGECLKAAATFHRSHGLLTTGFGAEPMASPSNVENRLEETETRAQEQTQTDSSNRQEAPCGRCPIFLPSDSCPAILILPQAR
jgi:hypothetical protein